MLTKLKIGKEQIKKIKLKLIKYLMKITSLESRLLQQQDANESLKEIITQERKSHLIEKKK